MLNKLLIGCAIAAVAAPANAVTIVSNLLGAPDVGPPAGYNIVVDFEPGWNSALNTVQVGEVYTGPQSLAVPAQTGRAAPAGTPVGGSYQSVGSGTPATGSSFFDFSSILPDYRPYMTGFSLYWGSVDAYNTIQFFNKDGNLVQAFTGIQISNPANGGRTEAATNRRVTFGFTQAENITGVKFLSTQDAFEFDDLALTTSVPEPASWAMLIGGFGLVGASMRRRRSTMAHVIA